MSDEIIIKEALPVYRGGYQAKFCHQVIQHMRAGKSLASFAGFVGVSPSTIKNWAEENEDFREAIEIAKSVSIGTWEDIAIEQATGESKGQSSTLTFMMKNLHPEQYKDKVNIEQEGNITFMIDTGIPTQIPDKLLEVKDIETTCEEVEDDGWESPDEDLL